MMIGNALRGTDGSGVIKVYADGQSDWRKQVGYPYHLWESKSFMDWWKDYEKADVRFLIGHCRWGTKGLTTVDNAHPFTEGKITLVHNGTLSKFSDLPDFKDYDVDSQAIAHSIDVQGIQKTVDGMDGAYSLVYYDDKEQTVNFIRNFERPMFIGMDDYMGRVYFSSEKKMLEWILDRNNINAPKDGFREVPTNTLVTFKLDNMVPDIKKVDKKHFFPVQTCGTNGKGTIHKKGTTKVTAVNDVGLDEVDENVFFGDDDITVIVDSVNFNKPSLPNAGDSAAVGSGKVYTFPTKSFKKNKHKKGKQNDSAGSTTSTYPNYAISSTGGICRQTNNLFGIVYNQRIDVEILDYTKVKQTSMPDRWLVECCIDEFPSIDVFFFVSGQASMDGLLVTGKLSGKVVSMEYNLDNVKDIKKRHKVWITDPIPSFELKKQEKLLLSNISEESLVDHRDASLGD
jgi:hypothetical protein